VFGIFSTSSSHPGLAEALRDMRRSWWSVALFSAVVNLLMLAGPLYMLQIYDRVLASRSIPTLVALSAFLFGAYLFQGFLDAIRGRVVVAVSRSLDERLEMTVHDAVVRGALERRSGGEANEPVRCLDQIRAFLTSGGPVALVDLPWAPVFVGICFLIHPLLGVVSLAGAFALLVVTKLTARANREPSFLLARAHGARAALVETHRRNTESIVAMGMAPALSQRWADINRVYVDAIERASNATGGYASLSKILRLLLQSAMLGFGAYLVIGQELTAGGMIAASIMMGRALAPVETAIANWRGLLAARDSIDRLSESLSRSAAPEPSTILPRPTTSLHVHNLTVAAPGSRQPIVSRIEFSLAAGEALAVVGPSGSGKTSLARSLVAVWRPAQGEIRLDGASLDQSSSENLGSHVGYLSQSVELFDGTVAENIARMALEPSSEAVIAAAQAAGAHEMILHLPQGYDTPIGEGGAILSAGQRQRVALARALYADPFLVVLDEPNSNLDAAGEGALAEAIGKLKARGAIAIVIAHRPGVLSVCDKVLYLADGVQKAFGPRDDVLRSILAPPRQAAAHANLKVVAESGAAAR
jgi:PrtD family type I secretion system ABC transporter